MRQLTKVDVILHKVGINTKCFIYWNTQRAEEAIRQLAYNNDVCKYRRKCIITYEGVTHDFTGEYDMYLEQGMTPYDAWYTTMEEFAWK